MMLRLYHLWRYAAPGKTYHFRLLSIMEKYGSIYSTDDITENKLKALRQDKGLSQELLAKMSGLSVRTIQRVESDGKASAETVLSIASVFNLSPKELQAASNEIEVNWSRKKIMKNTCALSLLVGTVIAAILLGVGPYFYIDVPAMMFVFLFTY